MKSYPTKFKSFQRKIVQMGALQKLLKSIQTLIIFWPFYPIHTNSLFWVTFEELPFRHFPPPNTSIRSKDSQIKLIFHLNILVFQTNWKQPYTFPVLYGLVSFWKPVHLLPSSGCLQSEWRILGLYAPAQNFHKLLIGQLLNRDVVLSHIKYDVANEFRSWSFGTRFTVVGIESIFAFQYWALSKSFQRNSSNLS